MKRIFLACVVAISVLAAEAQTTKSGSKKSKKAKVNSEAKAKADFEQMQLEKQQIAAQQQLERIRYDSTRLENERLANEKFEQERTIWKENKLREMDSMYKSMWKNQSQEKEQWLKIQRQRNAVNSSAKLDNYKSSQVNYINQTYHDKAKAIHDDAAITEDQKKEQYAKLNAERRARIKAVVGKSKERKLEKARKEYSQKNADDTEAAWINEAEGIAKNK